MILTIQDAVAKSRQELAKSERALKNLDSQWNILSFSEKYYYRSKLAQLREQYEKQRISFFKLEDEELRLSMGPAGLESHKERMLSTNQEIRGQSKTLDGVKTMGVEAHENLMVASADLRRQGEHIRKVQGRSDTLTQNLKKSDQIIETISYRKFKKLALLWFLAILLIVMNVIMFYLKIFR